MVQLTREKGENEVGGSSTVTQWCHYLEGAKHQFDIWNDHTNLQWFMKRQDLNRRQARWAQYLS